MDSAREAGIQRGGKTKSGAWKRFLLNPFRRVGNMIARLSGKKKKKKCWEYCFSVLPLCESKTPHQEAT